MLCPLNYVSNFKGASDGDLLKEMTDFFPSSSGGTVVVAWKVSGQEALRFGRIGEGEESPSSTPADDMAARHSPPDLSVRLMV